jgi:RNA polymerase sigma-70 factor (ECF subfamily)
LALDCAIEAARRAWPSFHISDEDFAQHLRERMDPQRDPAAALSELRASDLYLACGCARGDERARAALESVYFPDAAALIGTINPSASFTAQVLDQLKAALYGPGNRADGQVRIDEYRGRGSLRGWIQIVAMRLAHLRYAEFSQPDQIDHLAIAAVVADPALMRVRIHCGADSFAALLKQAIAQATAKMSAQDRNLLRWHLVENVSLRKIAFVRRQPLAFVAHTYAQLTSQMQIDLHHFLCGQTGLAPEDIAPAARRLVVSPAAISMMTVGLPVPDA